MISVLKTVLIGAAAYGVYKFATEKDASGKSIVDNIKEKAPEWKKKAAQVKEKAEQKLHVEKT